MTHELPGIHHVTAFSGDPQQNHDFYAELLGLRLLKVTINYDDPSLYHLYYGDGAGTPGTAITFFPLTRALPGRQGGGQTSVTRFSVPPGSLNAWVQRLWAAGIPADEPSEKRGQMTLSFEDPDGMKLELVEDGSDTRPGWPQGPIPQEQAIRGFHSVVLNSLDPESSVNHLQQTLGFTLIREDEEVARLAAPGASVGAYAEVLKAPGGLSGRMGPGTVHHVAWRAKDRDEQEHWRSQLAQSGTAVTSVRDRQYFQSIYSPEPGGVLYEIATDGPGFDLDEPVDSLGMELKLPTWLESRRDLVRAKLPSFRNSAGVQFP